MSGLITVCLILLFLLGGCGPAIIKTPAKWPVEPPSKRMPPEGKIPPTQRPYQIDGKTYYPLPSAYGYRAAGTASWYGDKFHGRKTSNGEVYNMHADTAAHKTLPMHTYLLVKNLENGRETIVRVNDRGPFVRGRIIDLSYEAARKLLMDQKGTAAVEITAMGEAMTYRQGEKTLERFLPHADFDKGEFYVQIGSFENESNAIRLKDKMLEGNRKTVVVKSQQDDRIVYRVQVRGGGTVEAAQQMERALSGSGFPEAFVIAR